jgi:hypothetical protein
MDASKQISGFKHFAISVGTLALAVAIGIVIAGFINMGINKIRSKAVSTPAPATPEK